MTEATPYAPCSKKGEIRVRVATMLMDAAQRGEVQATIARAADFYGPDTSHGIPNLLVFDTLARNAKASWLIDAKAPHSLTFTPDAALGVAMLAERESAWNQVWHLPTAPDPPTGKELIRMAATELGIAARYRVLHRPLLRLAGLFNGELGELYEMLYQYDSPYLFDSSKFAREFGFAGTPYAEGIRIAAASYRARA